MTGGKDFGRSEVGRGQVVGKYYLKEPIGQGGFGEVWKAHVQGERENFVALKVLHRDVSPKVMAEEARILEELGEIYSRENKADNIVHLVEYSGEEDPPFLALEYVRGDSLRHRLRSGGQIDIEEGLKLFENLVEALIPAHKEGYLHGDLKPENILLTEEKKIKLADFGLAKCLEDQEPNLSQSMEMTAAHKVEGTLAYMAPEQKKGLPLDTRSDIYALGIVLFEILTGERPQGGEKLTHLRPEIPPYIDEVYSRCFTHLDLRYKTAEEVKKAWNMARRKHLRAQEEKEEGKDLSDQVVNPVEARAFGNPLRRSMAFLIDLAALALIIVPLFNRVFLSKMEVLAFAGGVILYFILSTAWLGGTLGKLALGLKVVDEKGEKLSLWNSFVRFAGYLISLFFFGYGFYMIPLSEERRGLHDQMAGSWVVSEIGKWKYTVEEKE